MTTATSTSWSPKHTGAGLRVLLDGVFNHVGTDFPRYRDAVAGRDTSWFRHTGNDFETFEGHGELVALNHDNPDVVDYTVDVMTHWLRRGADGWRLDAAYAVPDRFWAQVLPRVRQEFGDAWFVGEVHPRRLLRRTSAMRASTRSPSTSCGRRSGAA